MMTDVSIIIVNYNTSLLLKNCIDSIQSKTSGCSYEIIVVDNASHDDSVEMVKRDYPDVTVIESKENLGFGRANNLGSKNASGKYFFYLNSDTILKNDAVSIFFNYAETHIGNNVGALGCILTGSDGNTCHSYGKMITPMGELRNATARYCRFLKYKWLVHPERIKETIEVEYITGADLFVPRFVFESTGGFDPDYFMYCEEVDWQKRMDLLGLKRLIIPGPEIIHLEGGSDTTKSRAWSKSRISNIQNSRKIFYSKHFDKKTLPFFLFILRVIQLPWSILK